MALCSASGSLDRQSACISCYVEPMLVQTCRDASSRRKMWYVCDRPLFHRNYLSPAITISCPVMVAWYRRTIRAPVWQKLRPCTPRERCTAAIYPQLHSTSMCALMVVWHYTSLCVQLRANVIAYAQMQAPTSVTGTLPRAARVTRRTPGSILAADPYRRSGTHKQSHFLTTHSSSLNSKSSFWALASASPPSAPALAYFLRIGLVAWSNLSTWSCQSCFSAFSVS